MRVMEVHQIAKAMVLETDPAYLRSLTNGGTRQVRLDRLRIPNKARRSELFVQGPAVGDYSSRNQMLRKLTGFP